MGDTYGGTKQGNDNPKMNEGVRTKSFTKSGGVTKSLCQIPSRFAIAMTDARWILRNEIIWFKRNCMPSSAKDRFTVDFEKMFFFTKSKKYWFEQQFENRQGETHSRGTKRTPPIESAGVGHKDWCKYMTKDDDYTERNKRCVWDITTKSFKGAHFAVFPPALAETPILSGCPENGIVLDPFAGSGTAGSVALKLNRNFILFDSNPEYCEMTNRRLKEEQMQLKLNLT